MLLVLKCHPRSHTIEQLIPGGAIWEVVKPSGSEVYQLANTHYKGIAFELHPVPHFSLTLSASAM